MSTQPPANTSCPAESGLICARRHWSVYWLLIVLALASVAINILHVRNQATRGDSPFFSANDRSRWCTIYAIVHFGTYEIDQVVNRPSSIHWDTIDKVSHVGKDGRFHQYSSKPTLLPTILAGEYWLIRTLTGWNLDDDAILIARIMLLVSNVLPFGLMLCLLAAVLERLPVSDWVRYFIVATAGFGTFLSPFCITLNNHLPAAVAVMAVIYCVDTIYRNLGRRSALIYFLAGLSSGFATANELPALALASLVFLLLLPKSITQTVLFFVPGFAVVGAAFFATNYLAHGLWEIPYSHRHDGAVIAEIDGDHSEQLDTGILPASIVDAARIWSIEHGQPELVAPTVSVGTWMGQGENILGRWVVRDPATVTQFAIVESDAGVYQLREWDNWYDFPGSYWSAEVGKRSDVDRGEASIWNYAFHMTFGHHGVFSLTPIWLLAMAGSLALFFDWRYRLNWLGFVSLTLTVVVFGFYLTRESHDRNYGGWTSGLRWLFWLIPVWLVSLAPMIQWMARHRWSRSLALILLLVGILSVNFARDNPWTHPWLYEIWDWTGLPK